jgi:hypothetical protein
MVETAASNALTSAFTGIDMVFTSFLRKIAGFNSETRASDDYTLFFGRKGGGDMHQRKPIALNSIKQTAS